MGFSALNLWHPAVSGAGLALLTGFLLGVLHGIVPDEHTWPITFSYAVGSYSARGGMRAGFLFSVSFAVQRALACELAYFAVLDFTRTREWNFWVYGVVGVIMVWAGLHVLRRGRLFHLFGGAERAAGLPLRPMPAYMPLVHGFVAGWGTGAFALILYTVLVPAMGTPALAFLPGLLFGLGTMTTQVLVGSLFGAWMGRRHLGDEARAYVGRAVAGRTLAGGGAVFTAIGLAGVLFPGIAGWRIATGLPVHNLDYLDIGFFLAVVVLFSVAGYAFWRAMGEARQRFGPGRAHDAPEGAP